MTTQPFAPAKKKPEACLTRIRTMWADRLWSDAAAAALSYLEASGNLWLEMPASLRTHHKWPGGFAVHICEVMEFSLQLALMRNCDQKFTDELLYAAFLHDLDKVHLRYEPDPSKPSEAQIKKARSLQIPLHDYPVGITSRGVSDLIDAAINGKPLPAPSDLSYHKYRDGHPPTEDTGAVLWLMSMHGLPMGSLEFVSAISTHHGGWSALAQSKQLHGDLTRMGVLLHAADLMSTQLNGQEV